MNFLSQIPYMSTYTFMNGNGTSDIQIIINKINYLINSGHIIKLKVREIHAYNLNGFFS